MLKLNYQVVVEDKSGHLIRNLKGRSIAFDDIVRFIERACSFDSAYYVGIGGSILTPRFHRTSDIDIFVVNSSDSKQIEILEYQENRIDIEFIPVRFFNDFNDTVKRINETDSQARIDFPFAYSVERVASSLPIHADVNRFSEIVDREAFRKYLLNLQRVRKESAVTDAIGAFLSRHWSYAVMRLRDASNLLLDRYLTVKGDLSVRHDNRTLKIQQFGLNQTDSLVHLFFCIQSLSPVTEDHLLFQKLLDEFKILDLEMELKIQGAFANVF